MKNNKAFNNAVKEGMYYPVNFYMYLDLENDEFYLPTFEKNLCLHHEYLHFVQNTTTSYGINTFIKELLIISLTQDIVNRLSEKHGSIAFPIKLMLPKLSSSEEEMFLDCERKIQHLNMDLSLLQGAYIHGDDGIHIDNKYILQDFNAAMFYRLFDDPSEVIPFGARSVMESSASVYEAAYLYFKESSGLYGVSEEARELRQKWHDVKEPSHVYWSGIYRYNDVRIKSQIPYYFTYLALADLALNVQTEINLSDIGKGVEERNYQPRSPGHRFDLALEASKSMPNLTMYSFHDDYYSFIEEVCSRLNWNLPWNIDHYQDNMLETIDKLELMFSLRGHEVILYHGLNVRKKYSSRCACPLNIMTEKEMKEWIVNSRKGKGNFPVAIFLEDTMIGHPPPYIRIKNDTVFSDFAKSIYSKYLAPDEDYDKAIVDPVRHFSIAHDLCRYIWFGEFPLACFLSPKDIGENDSIDPGLCLSCKANDIETVLGIDPKLIDWVGKKNNMKFNDYLSR